ncbi:S1 RNA-binding domain-containing protein [uncultured Kordia sp.]|uniref:S1 RNA-binding domain-containing protein n=1 Tax=uncultured Kordia sp. TaxID=507699 RepID=UPI002611C311|nr:S1 RNA-binding domain-containing protein [uncultured Kordia sp.]
MIRNINSWNALKKELHIGEIISGKVFKIEPHGIYIDINKDFYGIVLAPYISESSITIEDYPKIGEIVTGIIIHFSEQIDQKNIEFNYVTISMKDYISKT